MWTVLKFAWLALAEDHTVQWTPCVTFTSGYSRWKQSWYLPRNTSQTATFNCIIVCVHISVCSLFIIICVFLYIFLLIHILYNYLFIKLVLVYLYIYDLQHYLRIYLDIFVFIYLFIYSDFCIYIATYFNHYPVVLLSASQLQKSSWPVWLPWEL